MEYFATEDLCYERRSIEIVHHRDIVIDRKKEGGFGSLSKKKTKGTKRYAEGICVF